MNPNTGRLASATMQSSSRKCKFELLRPASRAIAYYVAVEGIFRPTTETARGRANQARQRLSQALLR